MKKIKCLKYFYIIFLSLVLVFFFSCTSNFDELNTKPDALNAKNVDKPLVGQAFAKAQYQAMLGRDSRFFEKSYVHYFNKYAQYLSPTINYKSDRYVDVARFTNVIWSTFYTKAAPQLKLVEDFTADHGMELENAIAKVWKVEMYHRITDFWGPIIYSDFGGDVKSTNVTIEYDTQEFIYKDFFKKLDEAEKVLKQHRGEKAFSNDDLLFGGDVGKWLKFTNSLRLRLAIHVKYIKPDLAQKEAEKAIKAGVMKSNNDNAMLKTTENSKNNYASVTDWGEHRMSAAMESLLEGYKDPREEEYFNPAENGDSDGNGSPYEGFRNGLPPEKLVLELIDGHSSLDTKYFNTNRGGTNPPWPVMRVSEVYFLRAEGALEGWNMEGIAQKMYEEGIRTSLEDRTNASIGDINKYIKSDNTPSAIGDQYNTGPLSDIPVAYDKSGNKERKLEQIITQKWLALFVDSWEAYTEKRRTGYPKTYPLIRSDNPDVPADKIFRRATFPSDEFAENPEGVKTAQKKLVHGPDKNSTHVWWDAKSISK